MAQDFAVQVYDSTLSATLTMSQIDANFAIKTAPTRYSLVTSSLAVVPATPAATLAGAQPLAQFRNILDGGDFATNPWQRGTSFAAIANTVTYTADRWAARGGASSSIAVSKQSIANSVLPGFSQAMQFGRTAANTDTVALNLAQQIESLDAIRLQSQQVTLSFYAKAGADFSSASSILNAALYMGTGTDEGMAKLINGATSGFTGFASLAPQAGSAAVALTTSWQRFFVTFNVPPTATELGVLFNYTPVGTAGTNDWFQITGVQLEVGSSVSTFEHRDIQVELEICQRYCWVISEPANGVLVATGGTTGADNVQNFLLYTPVQMRVAPTLTVTTGGFKIAAGAAAATATIAAGTTHTPNQITVTGAVTQAIGQAAHLQGGGSTGSIVANAEA